MNLKKLAIPFALVASTALGGCSAVSPKYQGDFGRAVGQALGAGAGAFIGNSVDRRSPIGAAVGAIGLGKVGGDIGEAIGRSQGEGQGWCEQRGTSNNTTVYNGAGQVSDRTTVNRRVNCTQTQPHQGTTTPHRGWGYQ